MKTKTSGKHLSELQLLDDEIQLLFEATQNGKVKDDYKDITGKTNKMNTIE